MKYTLIFIALALGGCITSRNAPIKQQTLIDKYPVKVLPVIRQAFPCIPGSPDSSAYFSAKAAYDSLARVSDDSLTVRAALIKSLFQTIQRLRLDSTSDNADLNRQLEEYAALLAEENAALRDRLRASEARPPVGIPVYVLDSSYAKLERLRREAAEVELQTTKGKLAATSAAYETDQKKWKGAIPVKKWLLALILLLVGLVIGGYVVYRVKKAPFKATGVLPLSIVFLSAVILNACSHIQDDETTRQSSGLWAVPLLIAMAIFYFQQRKTNKRGSTPIDPVHETRTGLRGEDLERP